MIFTVGSGDAILGRKVIIFGRYIIWETNLLLSCFKKWNFIILFFPPAFHKVGARHAEPLQLNYQRLSKPEDFFRANRPDR